MPVIPYQPEDIQTPAELVAAIRSRRGGKLLNLDRMLLHSPPFAAGWNTFIGHVRNDLALPDKLSELAICTVAILNGADYELTQHAPEFLKAGGTRDQLAALSDVTLPTFQKALFNRIEQVVIQLTIEMTGMVKVAPATMAAIKQHLQNDQHLVELVGVIATYNMVSRYLVALEIKGD